MTTAFGPAGLGGSCRALAGWLPGDTDPRIAQVVRSALADVGQVEEPLGSNRSAMIDAVNRRAGLWQSYLESGEAYWCASWCYDVWATAGLFGADPAHATDRPKHPYNCDSWAQWAKITWRWEARPTLGAVIVYGTPGDATHQGIVVRTDPLLLTVEGNTTAGPGYSRNGVAVDLKAPDKTRILGYVHPYPTPPP